MLWLVCTGLWITLFAGEPVPAPAPSPSRQRVYGCEVGQFLSLAKFPARQLGSSRIRDLDASRLERSTVFLFLDPDCPYVQSYADRIAALELEFRSRPVDFVFVYPGRSRGVGDDERFHRAHFEGWFVADGDCVVAGALQVLRTPEVLLTDATGRVLFRGGVDDQPFVPNLVRKRHLAEALNQHLAGERIRSPRAPVYG